MERMGIEPVKVNVPGITELNAPKIGDESMQVATEACYAFGCVGCPSDTLAVVKDKLAAAQTVLHKKLQAQNNDSDAGWLTEDSEVKNLFTRQWQHSKKRMEGKRPSRRH